MQLVLEEFEERVREINRYLSVLSSISKPNVVLFDKNTKREKKVLQEGSLKVMKATVFLLVYNLVESTVRSGFSHLYQQIRAEDLAGLDVKPSLRAIWVKQSYKRLENDSASGASFRKLTEDLVLGIAENRTLKLSSKLLPVSGNLDSDSIRKVCHSHGIPVKVHHRAFGGVDLGVVKEHRNDLAHGNISFSACGQQYTVSDLERITRQAVIFLRGILKNIKSYTDRHEYAC